MADAIAAAGQFAAALVQGGLSGEGVVSSPSVTPPARHLPLAGEDFHIPPPQGQGNRIWLR